ncbi:hypothetical protein Zmor_010985 [Zophobas morio]|uniref:Uncharacterized protein n=1 Tax=Zophobas morio TaxID=2755281 RepID=A0AA38MKG8_9CUCU|nr:hypothetical protein Zmor_010985 [Zophobas morio]
MMVPTSKDRPYQFYNHKSSTGKTYSVPSKSDTYESKPVDPSNLPTIEEWNKFVNYEKNKQTIQKNQFDFTAPVASVPTYSTTTTGAGEKSNFDFGAIEKPPTYGMQGNPWKKIIKFLTAFIPIGLLISALTPTVITVQSVNGT